MPIIGFHLNDVADDIKGFFDTKFENPNYIRKTRKQLLNFVLFSFLIIFFLALFSIGALAYFLIIAWIILGSVYLPFLRIWKYHGYSVLLLLAAVAIVVALSFFITLPIRNFISEALLKYLHSKGY